MEIKFAERMSSLRASEIRELLKLTEEPDIISFAGGLPAPELFPIERIKEACEGVLDADGKAALQYSATEGFRPLRKIIAEQRMKKAGVETTPDGILITSGSQQGLDFSGKIFINPGDTIICESPTYLGAINAFRAYQPRFVEIEMDDNGMIIEKLEEALIDNPDAKMIYTVPDFQNPSGKTMSLDRRKKLVELAVKYNIPVVEDNPYGELRFEGEMIPSIKSFDNAGIVIYLGTFSKTFCPGLRIGWVCAENDILSKYIIVKQGADLQPNSLSQREAALFMESFNLDDHIEIIKNVYRRRRDLMVDTIKKEFPGDCTFTYPEGGLFTWVGLRPEIDAAAVLLLALKEKVAFVPGGSFFPNGGHNNYFRLNYSNMPEDKIVIGIERLGKVLKSL
jgi:Transcriptional regulators containing a DNA-binding HTH domain and an aminotransferase domain (MocR family) and their eukaryotic orthologs